MDVKTLLAVDIIYWHSALRFLVFEGHTRGCCWVVLGRSWQCSTIQVDFNLPEKFNIEYVDSDGVYKQPITIHRALLGSLERFFGILIEHYAGSFPLWLAPVQAIIMPIADRHNEFAQEITEYFKQNGIRVEKDFRNEKIGFKIRESEVQKIPYMIVSFLGTLVKMMHLFLSITVSSILIPNLLG